ncbi:MAG: aspartate-semialdehyde dehydrogenase [Candidatus Peregrinibacteria bacterium]
MKKIGIVGVTGAVGQELLQVLFERKFPFSELVLLASERSAGKTIKTPFGEMVIEEFTRERAEKLDILFLAVGGDFSKEHAPYLAEKGVLVIDNSSAFRYDDAVPLIVPAINASAIGDHKLIANPNCTTAILGMPLFPIYQELGLKRVIVSTYQATSGAGAAGMAELETETRHFLAGGLVKNEVFAHPIPFNLIPQIDVFQSNGYTKEEMKVTWETRKIFNLPSLPISCTAVRIPTFRAHAESVTIETEKPVNIEKIREILSAAPGVDLVDNPEKREYPMPLNATKKYNVEVGRLRKNDVFGDFGLDFFVCGDQLLRGAALNAVEIAEETL